MAIIELKPRRFIIGLKVFLLSFIWLIIMKIWRYGPCPESEIWLFLRARAIAALIPTVATLLMPFRHQEIILTESTLTVPVKTKRWGGWESVTHHLTDINVSRAFKDWFLGGQLARNDGEIIGINAFNYPYRSIPKLLNEIEQRQNTESSHQNSTA